MYVHINMYIYANVLYIGTYLYSHAMYVYTNVCFCGIYIYMYMQKRTKIHAQTHAHVSYIHVSLCI